MVEVQLTAQHGMVVLHPGNSAFFTAPESLGGRAEREYRFHNITMPEGTCVEMGIRVGSHIIGGAKLQESAAVRSPEVVHFSRVTSESKLHAGLSLTHLPAEIGPDEVDIEGVSAVTPSRNVDILVGNMEEGGARTGVWYPAPPAISSSQSHSGYGDTRVPLPRCAVLVR